MCLLAAFTEVMESCLEVADLADTAEAVGLTDAVDAAPVPVSEVVDRCLEVPDLTEAVDLMDVVDGVFFVPLAEAPGAADLMEVSEMALISLPTEVVDFCLAVTDWMDIAFFVLATEVVDPYSYDGILITPAESC